MPRALLLVAVVFAHPRTAFAEIYTTNSRLDHALWPEHDPKLVVAGEIGAVDGEGALQFRVTGVILGADAHRGQTLTIPAKSFLWPQTLVPLEKGTSCILVLRPWEENGAIRYHIYTVVPGRKRDYRTAASSVCV